MNRLSSAEKAFIADRCELSPEKWVSKDVVYDAFNGWCKEEGISNPPTKSVFCRNMFSASGNQISATKRTDKIGCRIPVLNGVRLLEEHESNDVF